MTAAVMRERVAPLPVTKLKMPAKPTQHTSATAIPNLSGAPAMPTGLQHSSDDSPGIRRLRRGKGFSYCDDNGQTVSSRAERKRLTNLAIPPAYRDVWICPSPQGHLQATGRDARGRKQYLYHPDWRVARDETKFDRMAAFGLVLPRVRATVTRDLAQPAATTVSQTAVTAALVRLLDTTMVRVGNDEYARSNKSYGLTTLRKRHVALDGDKLRLKFRGKSGVEHEVALKDKRVARIVQRCQALPGQELFKYLDDAGQLHCVGSAEVNDYLRTASGGDFTAKDFRTWHGSATALALNKLRLPHADIRQQLQFWQQFEIVQVTPSIIEAALDLHQTRSLSYYDALVVAAAQTSGCTVLYSEDMNAGETIGGVRIVNPFVGGGVEG